MVREVGNVVECIKLFCDENADKYYVYEKYSGRFMFGRECIGIVVRSTYSYMDMIAKLTIYLNKQGIEDTETIIEGMCIDELGLDKIVYFPKIAS